MKLDQSHDGKSSPRHGKSQQMKNAVMQVLAGRHGGTEYRLLLKVIRLNMPSMAFGKTYYDRGLTPPKTHKGSRSGVSYEYNPAQNRSRRGRQTIVQYTDIYSILNPGTVGAAIERFLPTEEKVLTVVFMGIPGHDGDPHPLLFPRLLMGSDRLL